MASNATHCANYSKAGACRDRDSISVLCLPEEVWQNIALNLSAEDILSLLCVNRRLHVGLGQSVSVWKSLLKRDGISCYEQEPLTDQNNRCSAQQKQQKQQERQQTCFAKKDEGSEWRTVKNSYLIRCHKTDPSKSGGGVRWYPVRPYGQFAGISDREGHLSCVLTRHAISQYDPLSTLPISENQNPHATPQERIVVITGGFSNDDSIYLIHAGTGTTATDKNDNKDVAGRHHHWDMKRMDPIGRGPSFAYGATLTALPTTYSESPADGDRPRTLTATMRAIRFGGFLAGGYSNETSQVLMLTAKQDAIRVQKRHQRGRGKRERQFDDSSDDDEERWSAWEWKWNRQWEVEWSNITTTGITDMHEEFLPRAYHSSTLLLDRYLVVIGGMKTDDSIMNEAVLDTKTWTWIGNGAVACGLDIMDSRPSGRHGHSVVLDDSRNRLVLYGGGSGSDLLRSGEDNSEVWELHLGEGWRDSEKFAELFPWKWKQLHEDSNIISSDNNSDENEETTESTSDFARSCAPKLSPSETLCLGRCHHGIKISRDTVLFIFGSGRPSTNGLLAYDLRSDGFFRKQSSSQQLESASLSTFSDSCSTGGAVYVKGILPKPRFTGIAAFLEEDGYIITHGGYCSQDHDTIGTIDVLDLAPGVRGRLNNHASTFDGLSIDERRVSYGEVSDSQAEQGRQDPHAAMQRMLTTLINKHASERQAAARIMLHEMERGERPSNGQSLMLMAMIANGNPLLVGSEVEEGSDSE